MAYRPNSQPDDILYCTVEQRSLPCPVPYRLHAITPVSTSFVKFPFSCLFLRKNVNNTRRIRLVSTLIFYRKNRRVTETVQRMVARNVLTRKRFSADMGALVLKNTRLANFGPTELGPFALHTLHTLLLCRWLKKIITTMIVAPLFAK